MKELEFSNGEILTLSWSYYQHGYSKLLFIAVPSEDLHRFAELAEAFERTNGFTITSKDEDISKEHYELSEISSISYTPISNEYNLTLVVK